MVYVNKHFWFIQERVIYLCITLIFNQSIAFEQNINFGIAQISYSVLEIDMFGARFGKVISFITDFNESGMMHQLLRNRS